MNLKKELSFGHVFSIAAGAMISSGIFILPGLAFSRSGPAVFLAYFIAGMLALLGALSIIELATAMPKAGGDYYFINRSMGPLAGTISGLFGWVAISLKSAFAIFGMSEVIFLLVGSPLWLNSLMLTSGFVILNIAGVKEAAKLELWLVLGLLMIMVAYALNGFYHIDIERYTPLLPHGTNSLFITAGFVFVSFGGLISVATVAEEVKDPNRNIPLGMITAVAAVSLLYLLVLFITVGVLPADKLSNSYTPLADAARIFWKTPGYIIITIAAVLAFITTAVAGIMSASRYPLALSRDKLLPSWVGKVNHRTKTPIIALLLTGGFIYITLLLPLNTLVKAASTVIISANILANIAVIILRESKLRNYQPSFKAPCYPWLQIVSILLLSFFVIDMGMATIEISLGFLLLAVMGYMFYGRRTRGREYALLHLIARITNKRLVSLKLEEELREILHQRDDVIHDEFDKAVLEASVLDLDYSAGKAELFLRVAEELSVKLDIDKQKLVELMQARESESSTALSPFIAIPHIILEGSDKFYLLISRCKEGIHFSDEAPAVKAIFVIMGSLDTRQLHLKALAAIAQIVQDSEFKKKWLQADSNQHLQDILLLSKRKRSTKV